MTAGGICYHCGEWVTCLPDLGGEFALPPVRRGTWSPATRRWACFECVPPVSVPLPLPAPKFEPDFEHQQRELLVLRLGGPRLVPASEKVRVLLAEEKRQLRASQPWRRR